MSFEVKCRKTKNTTSKKKSLLPHLALPSDSEFGWVYSFDFSARVDYIAVGFLCKRTGSKHSHDTFSSFVFTRHTILLPYFRTNKHTTEEQFNGDKDRKKKKCNFH